MPKEIKDYVLDMQAALKKKKNVGQFSQEATIYHIIREHKKMTEKK